MTVTRTRHPWPDDELADDFRTAVCGQEYSGSPETKTTGGDPTDRITEFEVDAVARWHVSYHGTKWKPGDNASSELSLHAVLQLRSGLWASVVAGNDYTGWGCQDFSDVRIGMTEADVSANGLDAEGRRLLGYEAAAEDAHAGHGTPCEDDPANGTCGEGHTP